MRASASDALPLSANRWTAPQRPAAQRVVLPASFGVGGAPGSLKLGTPDAILREMPNSFRSGRVLAVGRVPLGFVALVCVVAVLFAAAGTAPAAQSKKPAACRVTPCLLIGSAGGDTFVFTAWESNKSPTIPSIDLTLFTSSAPTDVRSTGKCAAPVGPGHYSQTETYYNVTCTLTPAGRAIQVCFKDSAGLEKHANTSEFLQNGVEQAYEVMRAPAVAKCPL